MYEKPDFYTKKAKEEGYLARSIYKLQEIQNKFDLIKKNQIIADLGCAPGSWTQYCSDIVGHSGRVIGIDYKEIKVSAPNIILVHGNFLREHNKEAISSHAPFDGVISDMAPDTSGDRLTDCFNSSELVKNALRFSFDYLKKGGFFVAKIFQGGEEKEIMEVVKKSFNTAKWFKPSSCRKNSFEIFIIGIGFIEKSEFKKNNISDFEFDENSGEMPW